jgi:hypothetical protein
MNLFVRRRKKLANRRITSFFVNFPHFIAGETVPAFPLVTVVAEKPALIIDFFADFPQRNVYWLWV